MAMRRGVRLVRDEELLHFSLEKVLPSGQLLAINGALGTMVVFTCCKARPRMLVERQFTPNELAVSLPLIEAHPYYCPYEVLLASFTYGHVSEVATATCKKQLQEARAAGLWDQEMRPVRNLLSRARLKLLPLGIDIVSIAHTGYMLKHLRPHAEEESDEPLL